MKCLESDLWQKQTLGALEEGELHHLILGDPEWYCKCISKPR